MNEAYFVNVFKALLHTREPLILKRLLLVIRFYNELD